MSRSEPSHDAVAARAAGKQAVAARTAWTLHVGGGSFRCLRREGGAGFEVQARTSKGWIGGAGAGRDAGELLRRLVATKQVDDLARSGG